MRLIDVPAETRLTFVCEKPSQARNYARAWHYARPDVVPPLFIALRSLTGAKTVMPRHIAYKGLPRFLNPTWKRLDHEPRVLFWEPLPSEDISETEDLTHYERMMRLFPGSIRRSSVSVDDALAHADLIVYGCDSDTRGAGMFSRFLETRMGLTHDSQAFPVVYTWAEDPKSLKAAFSLGMTTRSREFQAMFNVAEAKQVFYFNWALNALPIFGDVLRHVGVTDNVFLSKFQMLLLHVLAEQPPMMEGPIHLMMRDWKGSGKWSKGDDVFGSPASRGPIIEQLVKAGLLCESQAEGYTHRTHYEVSDVGKAFLAHVHPDCYDPDIGFRLAEWGRTWPASRPAMERYVRTYFGKQKRFFTKIWCEDAL